MVESMLALAWASEDWRILASFQTINSPDVARTCGLATESAFENQEDLN